MGQFSEISKFMKELDNKYQKKWKAEGKIKDDDALIKHVEEEYKKEQGENDNIK